LAVYLLLTRNNINELFRFNKKPKVTSKRPTNIYSNRFYENIMQLDEDINDAEYYDKKQSENEPGKIDEILIR
jgi:hypothetical protein